MTDVTRRIEGIQTEIASLRTVQNQAHDNNDFEAAQDIGVQISKLQVKINLLRATENQAS